MQVQTTSLDGVLLFVPTPFRDERGFFSRTFDAADARAVGLDPDAFVQDSQSRSARGVVRGMHGRRGGGEAKLVRCAHGAIHDVVVDARAGSPTFGRMAAFRLDDENLHTLYIPRGFLHGYQALTAVTDFVYRIDDFYGPNQDVTIKYDDPDLAVPWPAPITIVSKRDRESGISWADYKKQLGVG